MTEVHVFGVMGARATAPPTTRAIVHGDLAAIVQDAESTRVAATQLLRAHSRVLEAAAAEATVLPVRFGTAMADDAAVVEQFLRPQHDELAARLAGLEGKVQLTVKAFYEEEALLRGVVAESPSIARLRERVRALPEAAGYLRADPARRARRRRGRARPRSGRGARPRAARAARGGRQP